MNLIKTENMTVEFKVKQDIIKNLDKVSKPNFNKVVDLLEQSNPEIYKFFEQYKEKAKKLNIKELDGVNVDTTASRDSLTKANADNIELAKRMLKKRLPEGAVRQRLQMTDTELNDNKIDEIISKAKENLKEKITASTISSTSLNCSDELQKLKNKIQELEKELENKSKSEYNVTGDVNEGEKLKILKIKNDDLKDKKYDDILGDLEFNKYYFSMQ